MSQIICPYCFQGWPRSTAAFRCLGPADDPNCPRLEDEALAEITGRPELRKKVILKSARFGRTFDPPKGGVKCDCGARTVAVCPNCHHQLPHAYAEGGDRLIGMVGTKSSGKSHFIAILFHELFERVGVRYKARVEMLDDDTRERVRGELLSAHLPRSLCSRAVSPPRWTSGYDAHSAFGSTSGSQTTWSTPCSSTPRVRIL